MKCFIERFVEVALREKCDHEGARVDVEALHLEDDLLFDDFVVVLDVLVVDIVIPQIALPVD